MPSRPRATTSKPVLGLESQVVAGRSEHHRADLRRFVLEREIHVAGVPHTAVRDFSLDPDVTESRFDGLANRRRQLRDGDDPPARARATRRSRSSGDRSSSNGCEKRSAIALFSTSSSCSGQAEALDARRLAGCRVGGDFHGIQPAGPVAASNRAGMPVRKRPSAASIVTPMIESCGPVMPTSV